LKDVHREPPSSPLAMKKNDGSVDEGPVDESFIGSVPHATVAGDATDAEPKR